jgi:hypothetical protein
MAVFFDRARSGQNDRLEDVLSVCKCFFMQISCS